MRRKLAALARLIWAAIRSEIGREEIYLAGALILIALGFWDLWRPGAWLVPGFTLLWISLPCRARFVEPIATAPERKAERM